MQAGLFFIFE